MAVSMATLGFSFPAHKMPNQGWRGTVSSLVGEKILSFLSILLGPIHTREGAGRGGLGLLDPQRPSDSTPLMTDHQRLKKARGSTELVCNLVQRELGNERGGGRGGEIVTHTCHPGEDCPWSDPCQHTEATRYTRTMPALTDAEGLALGSGRPEHQPGPGADSAL